VSIYGFGVQPFGTTAGGVGSPSTLPAPGYNYEAIIDLVPAREIDLLMRDYVVDDDTAGVPHDEMDPVTQSVILRLTTRKGSLAFDRTFGNDLLNATKATGDLQRSGERAVRECLGDLLQIGAVILRYVAVTTYPGGVLLLEVGWTNTATSQERVTRAEL